MSTEAGRLPVAVPADWVSGPSQGQWTYKEYAALPEDGNRYEVLQGVLYMAPSPGTGHQRISTAISYYLYAAVELTGMGVVCTAPLDVMLDAKNTVQPDVLVVLNEHFDRVTKAGIVGAPDLVVEIASPSTARIDLNEKLAAYASAGVPEYWVVNPDARTVEVLTLRRDVYSSSGAYYGPAVLPSRVVPGLNVKVEQFFP